MENAAPSGVTVEPGRRGAVRYQAPEVLARGVISPAADSYAFGVLLWEMLTAQARPESQGIVHGCAGLPPAPRANTSG
jgi:hypothetical protein